ncbi:MAG: hypothetical protein V4438_03995 [Patescibacteria group bacterium]
MPKRPTIVSLAAAMLIISATFSSRVSASTSSGPVQSLQSITISDRSSSESRPGKRKKEFQGVAGVVSSVSGQMITIEGKDNTTYIVDASGARVVKKGSPEGASLSDIKSGDKLLIKGVVTGSTVAATDIFEGRGKKRA